MSATRRLKNEFIASIAARVRKNVDVSLVPWMPKPDGATGAWNQAGQSDAAPLDSSRKHVAASEATPAAAPDPPKPMKPDGIRS